MREGKDFVSIGRSDFTPEEIYKYILDNPEKFEVFTFSGDNIQDNVNKKVDRVGNWDKWAQIMHDYINNFTVSKYGAGEEDNEFDLMSITEPRICIWNILKYSFRLWKGKGKIHDLHKISHYAEMAFTLSKGDLTKAGITNQKGD